MRTRVLSACAGECNHDVAQRRGSARRREWRLKRTSQRICVVGAGPAGLVTTKTLKAAGLEVDCFEMSSVVGGHWVLDNPNERSAAYESLRANTSKKISRFSDFEMPADWPHFPPREHLREWFERYVDHFGLRKAIHTDHEVTSARPERVGWSVCVRETGHSVSEDARHYRALIAATGSYWSPRMPGIDASSFSGTLLHASRYRSPERPVSVAGRRVLVVGIGNTGCELACEMAAAGASRVFLSARSGRWILPKLIDGRPAADLAPMTHPTDPVPGFLQRLPARWRQRFVTFMAERALRKRVGTLAARYEELGLPPAPTSPLSKRPTVSEDLLGCLENSTVVARRGLAQLEHEDAVFDDGTREPVDVVYCATGYHLRYPYLEGDVLRISNDDLELFMGVMPPTRRDLFVVGVSRPTGSFWPIAEAQAQFVAALLSGQYEPPPENVVTRRLEPILDRSAINPALYGLALREEVERGRARARKHVQKS